MTPSWIRAAGLECLLAVSFICDYEPRLVMACPSPEPPGLTASGDVAVLLILLAHQPKAAVELLFPLLQDYGAKKSEGVPSVVLVCARLAAVFPADERPDYVRKLVLSCYKLLCVCVLFP